MSIRRHKDMLPLDVRKSLVSSLVLPLLDYGSMVCFDMPVDYQSKVQRLQNSCLRFMYDLGKYDHISSYLTCAKWLNMLNRRKYFLLCFLYKVLVSRCPTYLFNELCFMSTSHRRSNHTSAITLRVPFHRTNKLRGAFVITAPLLWNALPPDIRMCKTVITFRTTLFTYLLKCQTEMLLANS